MEANTSASAFPMTLDEIQMTQENLTPSTTVMQAPAPVEKVSLGSAGLPVAPKNMTNEAAEAIKEQASGIIRELMANSDNTSLLDQIATLGIQAQEKASQTIETLRAPINNVITPQDESEIAVPETMAELRRIAEKLDPEKIVEPTLKDRLFSMLPGAIKDHVEQSVQKLREAQMDCEDAVNIVLDKLRSAGETIMRSNSDIDQFCRQLEEGLVGIKNNAYLCETMMYLVQQEGDKLPVDDPKRGQVMEFYAYLSARNQDFYSQMELFNQFLIGLATARKNNIVRALSLRRTIDVAGPALRVGLVLQILELQQQKAAELDRTTRGFVGDLLVKNAKQLGQQQKQALDDLGASVVAVSKAKEAHTILMQTMDARDGMLQQITEVAKKNTAEFASMVKESEDRRQGIKAPNQQAPAGGSIEAAV